VEAQADLHALKGKFGDAVVELRRKGSPPPSSSSPPPRSRKIARFLKDTPAPLLRLPHVLSGVDYKEKFAVAYHLHSMKHRHAIA